MSKPYLLYSDPHFHAWDAFSEDAEGLNSRLCIILDELEKAYNELRNAGGSVSICGGDLFHVRGSVRPTVLNPVLWFYRSRQSEGFKSYAISGNHDNERRDSSSHGSMVTALNAAGVEVVAEPTAHWWEVDGGTVMCLPWFATVEELKEEIALIDSYAHVEKDKTDLIIHAPVDGVLMNVPEHGLTADWLADQGFRRVFAGHYHNHKDFGNGVYSIGALTHQTWSDVGTKAGYLLVYPDRVEHYETDAPKFVDIDPSMTVGDVAKAVAGNYVRVTLEDPKPEDVQGWREMVADAGAAGVLVRSLTSKVGVVAPRGTVTRLDSLAESVTKFAKDKGGEPLAQLCEEILKEVT